MRSTGLIGVLAGLAGAAIYLTGVMGSPSGPLLMGLAPFPFFVAALGWGGAAGLVAGGVALLALIAVASFASGSLAFGLASALAMAAVTIGPALWLSRRALFRRHIDTSDPQSPVEWYPPGRLLLWLTGLGCGGFLALELLAHAATGTGLPGIIAAQITELAPPEARQALVIQMKAPNWETLLALLSSAMPALGGVVWQIWLAANGIGAHLLLVRTGRSLRPGTGWQGLGLPRAYAALFLLALAVGLAGAGTRYWGASLGALLFVPYFFLGLSVVHAIPLKGPGRFALLGLFYFLLLLQVWPAFLVGMLGLLEQWSGLRARLLAGTGRPDRRMK